MTDEMCRRICEDRLRLWGRTAAEQHCTPLLMLAVGHDHAAGEVHLHLPREALCEADTIHLLREVLALLEGQQYEQRVEGVEGDR